MKINTYEVETDGQAKPVRVKASSFNASGPLKTSYPIDQETVSSTATFYTIVETLVSAPKRERVVKIKRRWFGDDDYDARLSFDPPLFYKGTESQIVAFFT